MAINATGDAAGPTVHRQDLIETCESASPNLGHVLTGHNRQRHRGFARLSHARPSVMEQILIQYCQVAK
jgi:hypothetical protein